MKILIIRHGLAEDRESFATTGRSDTQRPLTDKGKKRMRQTVKGLKHFEEELDFLISSPLARARETAEIIEKAYPTARRFEYLDLSPGYGAAKVAAKLRELPADSVVALVGHEPDLSELVAWLTAGTSFGFLRLKRGGVCALETPGAPDAGKAELVWALSGSQLRMVHNLDV